MCRHNDERASSPTPFTNSFMGVWDETETRCYITENEKRQRTWFTSTKVRTCICAKSHGFLNISSWRWGAILGLVYGGDVWRRLWRMRNSSGVEALTSLKTTWRHGLSRDSTGKTTSCRCQGKGHGGPRLGMKMRKANTIIAASICGTFSLDFCIGTECSIIVQVPIVF